MEINRQSAEYQLFIHLFYHPNESYFNASALREECFRAGMNDYIAKPFNLEEMLSSLRKAGNMVNQRKEGQ